MGGIRPLWGVLPLPDACRYSPARQGGIHLDYSPFGTPGGIWGGSKPKRRYETPSLILQIVKILKILLMRFSSHENPVHVLAMSFFSEICAVFGSFVLKNSTIGRFFRKKSDNSVDFLYFNLTISFFRGIINVS